MIDEHHPMQIGIFPMDLKCHTPQQLQQQQQQLQTTMLTNGNERMLTSALQAPHQQQQQQQQQQHMTSLPAPANVSGSRSNRHNMTKNNKTNSDANSNQQSAAANGPGPPRTAAPATTATAATSASGRVTHSECGMNAFGVAAGGNNNNNNNHFNGNSMHCDLQQHPLSLQQQNMLQHHLQQLQLHPPALSSLLLPHQQHQRLEPPPQQQHLLQPPHQHLHQHQSIIHQHSGNATAAAASVSASASTSVTAAAALDIACATHCGLCCQPICDRYIMRVVDTSYHEGCLKCSTCALHLVHSCFARDGKLYCRIDYERHFVRNRCLGCGHKIGSEELVMRTLENVFHLKCFACVVCGALLKKGEQYVVKQGQLFCRFDYEKEVEMLQGYDFYADDLFPPKMDGRRGPKRPRTILNTQQRRAFKASFEVSPKPCRKVRENLAKETGLSLRIVQVWFQNQRAKVKKIQKKAKQEHPKGASETDSQESDSSLAKVKDEAHSDSESLLESPFSVCSAVGGANSDGGAKMRLVKDENTNAPFNCMETNKENCNKTNEPILNTILGLSYATFQQLMGPFTQSPMINPIDRLYSMQNSYFRPDEVTYDECGSSKMANN